MSKYADLKSLFKILGERGYLNIETGFEEIVLNEIEQDLPTIDIVRCQDCKYWVYNFNGCSRNPCTEPWYATDFCSYGERKE